MGSLLTDGPYGVQHYVVAHSIKDLGLEESDEKKISVVDLAALGRPISKVRPTLARFFKSALEVTEPTISGSMFLSKPADLSWLNNQLMILERKLERSGFETGLIAAEMDNLKKSILLTSAPPSKHIEVNGLFNNSPMYPESIKLLKDYFPLSHSDRMATPVDLTTARGTNHGWPTFMSGADSRNSVDLLVHLKLASILMDECSGDLDMFAEMVRKRSGVSEPLASSMFFRRQPTNKWSVEFNLTSTGPRFRGATKGKFCRQRQVFGVPLFINSALRPMANYIRAVYKRQANFNHKTPDDTLAFLQSFKGFTFFSEDLSGYDKSVSVGCQQALRDYYYSQCSSQAELNLYTSLSYIPVLAPPLTSTDQAFLYKREGQTISGSIFTDKDGTLINFARIANCIAAATGWSLGRTRREFNKLWTCLVLGDDCVIGYSDSVKFDRDSYNAESSRLGFKTEAFEGAVFLMNYFSLSTNSWFGIASRGLDRTFNKEYAVDDPVVDLFGTYNRVHRLENHPLGGHIIDLVCSRPAAQRAGISNYDDLRRLANSPGTLAYLISYGEKAGKQAKMRDMMAGLTHGSLLIEDIANSEFTPTQLTALEAALAGLTISDENAFASAKLPDDIWKYIQTLSKIDL